MQWAKPCLLVAHVMVGLAALQGAVEGQRVASLTHCRCENRLPLFMEARSRDELRELDGVVCIHVLDGSDLEGQRRDDRVSALLDLLIGQRSHLGRRQIGGRGNALDHAMELHGVTRARTRPQTSFDRLDRCSKRNDSSELQLRCDLQSATFNATVAPNAAALGGATTQDGTISAQQRRDSSNQHLCSSTDGRGGQADRVGRGRGWQG